VKVAVQKIYAVKSMEDHPRLVSPNRGFALKEWVLIRSIFRAVRDAILSVRYKSRIDGFVTLHTYSQIWVI
jgi:hypothetical protein